MNQIQRLLSLSRVLIVFVIIISLAIVFTTDSFAAPRHKASTGCSKKRTHKHHTRHPRRAYHPEATRQQAIDLIRSNSEQISELAGLEPSANDRTHVAFHEPDTILQEQDEDIEELEREDDVTVDMESLKMLWLTYMDDESKEDELTVGGANKQDIMDVIMDWLGTPYYFGGLTNRGIDCSAFVQRVFLESNEIALPRTANEQFQIGTDIKRNNLQFGDLVFFHTRRSVYASHVGIYLGDNLFAHSSSRYGVTVSSLESTYYDNRFIGARRVSSGDIVKFGTNGSGRMASHN